MKLTITVVVGGEVTVAFVYGLIGVSVGVLGVLELENREVTVSILEDEVVATSTWLFEQLYPMLLFFVVDCNCAVDSTSYNDCAV